MKELPFFHLSQKLENLALRWQGLARLYFRLFYQNMLEKELQMSKLKDGAKVLHLGCGAYPYTALFLAKRGFQVEAWDYQEEAVKKARRLVEEQRLENLISFACKDGSQVNGNHYDAIWVSLNVYPKHKILKQAFSSLKPEGVLLYRNMPRWTSFLFPRINSGNWSAGSNTKSWCPRFGSEIVLVKSM